MKKTYLYISNSLNNKKFYLCYCLIIVGCLLAIITRESMFDSFFVNISDLLTSKLLNGFVVLSLGLNILNIISDFKNNNIMIRLTYKDRIIFFKKEILFSICYFYIILLLLVLSFSLLFNTGVYSIISNYKYANLSVAFYDTYLIIFHFLRYLLFSYIIFLGVTIVKKVPIMMLLICLTISHICDFFVDSVFQNLSIISKLFLEILNFTISYECFAEEVFYFIMSIFFLIILAIILEKISKKGGNIYEISI